MQLALDPLNRKRKRVSLLNDGSAELAFRTWRLQFLYSQENHLVEIKGIKSGYSQEDLTSGTEDKYGDKDLHRAYTTVKMNF